jgi:alkylation response protein AidB-like acyl-CoA dehydrogenase
LDFELSSLQISARERVTQQFAGQPTYNPDDVGARKDFWRECNHAGILGLLEAEEFGGSSSGAVATAAALEELGYLCKANGLAFGVAAQMLSVMRPIGRFGSGEQKVRLLPSLISGESVGAHCVTESEAGSDILSMGTVAEPSGSGFRLNGKKTYITNGSWADVYLVLAKTRPEHGVMGLSAFLLKPREGELVVGAPITKMGIHGAEMSEIKLVDYQADKTMLLGKVGQGFQVFREAMAFERALIPALLVGQLRRVLDRTVERAKIRKQFGQSIGRFQVIGHRIATMRTSLCACRLFLYKSAAVIDAGRRDDSLFAMTKLFVSEQCRQVAVDAMSIWGAEGFTVQRDIQESILDAIGSTIYSGTSDIMRGLIASQEGL